VSTTKTGLTPYRLALGALYAASAAVLLALLWAGSSYYTTPMSQRSHHPGYWTWKPGGSTGELVGVIGSTMMVVMLVYSLRKRVHLFRRFGALSRWLDFHIYLGTMGPLLVILHSSFKVHGLVALSFWSMIAVALSGVLGRYLYLQIPRTRAGEELTLADLAKQDKALSETLVQQFRLDERLIERLDALAAPPQGRRGLAAAFASAFLADLTLRYRLRGFVRECRGVPPDLFGEFLGLARRKAVLRRRIVFWDALHRLFHYWHVIHKPFAIVMYVFMVVHIVVASMTGYGWAAAR
jgi:hypothetical protein